MAIEQEYTATLKFYCDICQRWEDFKFDWIDKSTCDIVCEKCGYVAATFKVVLEKNNDNKHN